MTSREFSLIAAALIATAPPSFGQSHPNSLANPTHPVWGIVGDVVRGVVEANSRRGQPLPALPLPVDLPPANPVPCDYPETRLPQLRQLNPQTSRAPFPGAQPEQNGEAPRQVPQPCGITTKSSGRSVQVVR